MFGAACEKEKVRTIKTYYLIDYENVHGDGLTGCGDLNKKDRIVIFFTKNAKSIDMSEIADHGNAKIKMIEVSAGKQSADMHIGSYLGYLAGRKRKKCKVVVVSKDTDYDNIIKFWKKKTGIKVSRAQQINKKAESKKPANRKRPAATKKTRKKRSGAGKTKLNSETIQAMRSAGFDAPTANKEKNALNTNISDLLKKAGYSNDIVTYVVSVVVKNFGTKNAKQQTYRGVVSKYGQNKGLEIYNHIKKHI